ncbi:hypothetical protein HN51_067319 [Arachis hypogaea]|uniref:TF-B3 domain-containing protein n=1 Tax=Arachis hypogaea TaxID=3818 RepID=G0Y6T5_ARAHY|nr:B3 domain-containing protein At1g05920-like [Arachis ipaensis]XP_025648190.1 B3 domain-containing protein At1g05920 [Arachis hypogaea]AEL30345.1 hypothetical protein 303L13_5 [Arachis hypogaea]
MDQHRATLCCQWLQCKPRSSCSSKNKLKETLMDSDDSTVKVPFSSTMKVANAFGYCLEGANEEEERMMNIKKTKRDCFIQNKEYDFNDDELEVVDVLFNLPRNFLERVNLETSISVVNSSSSADQERVSKEASKKETKKPVNQERNSPSAVNSGPSADQERVSNMNSNKTVNLVDSQLNQEPVNQEPVNQESSELPQNFKNLISDMGGSRITLLIEKTLYPSDLNPQQNRLSIPSQRVKDKDFLLPTELETLEEKKGIKVKLIQPSLEITELTLIKWFMHKGPKSEKVSVSYILRSNWVKVAKANNLQKDDVIQVWSFRVEDKLCMAIVKL